MEVRPLSERDELVCIAQTVGALNRTVRQLSDIVDVLFAYVARHATPEELETIADNVKRGDETS